MRSESANEILIFGLSSTEMDMIMSAATGCSFIKAHLWQDIVGIPADLVILNPTALNEESLLNVMEYYKEIDPSAEKLLLTKKCDAFDGLFNVEVVEDFLIDEKKISTTLLRILHNMNKDYDYSRRLMLSLRVMKEIADNPGCSTKDIARNVEISERSVKRYIDTLRVAGAIIDFKGKGWYRDMPIWEIL